MSLKRTILGFWEAQLAVIEIAEKHRKFLHFSVLKHSRSSFSGTRCSLPLFNNSVVSAITLSSRERRKVPTTMPLPPTPMTTTICITKLGNLLCIIYFWSFTFSPTWCAPASSCLFTRCSPAGLCISHGCMYNSCKRNKYFLYVLSLMLT